MQLYIMACFIFITLITVGCDQKTQAQKTQPKAEHSIQVQTYYTCSMHPNIQEDHPGKCPICGMNLAKIKKDQNTKDNKLQAKVHTHVSELSAGEVIAHIRLNKSQLSHFKPAFFPVTKMQMQKKIRLLGLAVPSESRESHISARVDGRVEKVYVKSTGSSVQVGDPIIDLYSPRLITAGQEYLVARQSYQDSPTQDFKQLWQQSEARLKAWGIQKAQYESWFKRGSVPQKIRIYSSASGTVRKRNATAGKYFKEGEHLFELSDLKDLWVEMDVYEHDAGLVQLNQTVNLQFTALPGEVFLGKVDFIDPVLNMDSRTLKIRTTISNVNGKLKPGMVADATLHVKLEGMPLVVPRMAVIDTGKRKVVWVKIDEQTFQSKIIHTGHESEGYIEVKGGLIEGEQVVMEGSFLLDAQAQLFGGYEDI